MKEKFINFLKKYKAYENFSKSLITLENKTLDEYYKRCEERKVPLKDIIIEAFTWKDTEDGNRYWYNINELWRKELEKKSTIMETKIQIDKTIKY